MLASKQEMLCHQSDDKQTIKASMTTAGIFMMCSGHVGTVFMRWEWMHATTKK